MTLGEFSKQLKTLLLGESKGKDDMEVIRLNISLALRDIAMQVVPVVLLTKDYKRYPILRQVDRLHYIREPITPQNENDEILIDTSLELALLFKVASSIVIVDRRKYYEQKYQEELGKHRFATYEALSRSDEDESLWIGYY